jgi:hypothetical protein
MVTLTILYSLSENQPPNRSNGARGLLSLAWQGLRAPVACAPLVLSLPCTVGRPVPLAPTMAAANASSYEELQAADVALPEGVALDIRYLIVW